MGHAEGFKVGFKESVIQFYSSHRTSWPQCGGWISGAKLEKETVRRLGQHSGDRL